MGFFSFFKDLGERIVGTVVTVGSYAVKAGINIISATAALNVVWTALFAKGGVVTLTTITTALTTAVVSSVVIVVPVIALVVTTAVVSVTFITAVNHIVELKQSRGKTNRHEKDSDSTETNQGDNGSEQKNHNESKEEEELIDITDYEGRDPPKPPNNDPRKDKKDPCEHLLDRITRLFKIFALVQVVAKIFKLKLHEIYVPGASSFQDISCSIEKWHAAHVFRAKDITEEARRRISKEAKKRLMHHLTHTQNVHRKYNSGKIGRDLDAIQTALLEEYGGLFELPWNPKQKINIWTKERIFKTIQDYLDKMIGLFETIKGDRNNIPEDVVICVLNGLAKLNPEDILEKTQGKYLQYFEELKVYENVDIGDSDGVE